MIVTSMYITTAGGVLASSPAPEWSENQVGLFMTLFNFNTVWIPALLMATWVLTIGRRRPGRLFTVGILGRVKAMRSRVVALSMVLEEAAGWSVRDKRMIAIRMTEQRRWEVARLWLYGPSFLASLAMLHGALGAWGGQIRLWPVISALLFLALSGAAAGVESWSRRRADPYGNAARSGMLALEALVREDSAESHFKGVWRAFRDRDRRPAAYFSVDWTFRSVEGFCLSMEYLARYAVRSGDSVGRVRREHRIRVFTAHVQEALGSYCEAADAHAAGDVSDDEVRVARRRVTDLIAQVLVHLCRDRLILPTLVWDDLPEDRRSASPLHAGRRTVVHTGVAILVLAALAALFTWARVPGELVSPVLVVLGGIVAVMLPRARWPE
ncbi:hypothetical protein [Streptomyces microflavus]|uniref:hypothetical protein n=1 Tax=Streptomyces microflavus TaxID=1919 RepID=UPI00339EDE04